MVLQVVVLIEEEEKVNGGLKIKMKFVVVWFEVMVVYCRKYGVYVILEQCQNKWDVKKKQYKKIFDYQCFGI